MSIAGVLTRGYGAFAGAAFVPTRGYLAGLPGQDIGFDVLSRRPDAALNARRPDHEHEPSRHAAAIVSQPRSERP